jgi:hypothetical protein
MSKALVICQFDSKPHELEDECQRVTYLCEWAVGAATRDDGWPLVAICGKPAQLYAGEALCTSHKHLARKETP